jgi:hypothetical protein
VAFAAQGAGATGVPTDTLAIVSLVLGILSVVTCGILAILGPVAIILGAVGRGRIQNSGGTLKGGGLALAGLILGIVGTIILGIAIIGVIARVNTGS